MKPIRSPHERSSLVKTGTRIANGREMARMTATWMEGHRDEFLAMLGFVRSLQARSDLGRVRDRIAVWCQQSGIDMGLAPYKFGNAYWAGIARYMALVDPSLVGAPLKFNDSDIDCYGLLPVSWLPGLGEE